jgi:hypothetical protein
VEGPILARLQRMNLDQDFLKPGDVVEVCGFPFRKEILSQRSTATSPGPSLPSLHAHVLVTPDGKMRPWGPYGKLENCIRATDRPQAWLDFVNRDPMAREYWCRSRTYVKVPSIAPQAFIDEIDRRMAKPCE